MLLVCFVLPTAPLLSPCGGAALLAQLAEVAPQRCRHERLADGPLVEQFTHLALGISQSAVVVSGGRVAFSGAAAELVADPALLQKAYLGE